MNQPTPPSRRMSTLSLRPKPTLPTITKAPKQLVFSDIPEVQLHQPTNNMSTTAPDGTSSTQTNGGNPHQSPLRAPSPAQVIQGNAELNQIQVQVWDKEAYEDEATEEEEKLTRVQQKIERLRQKQESIMRRQEVAQRAEAQRQHINRERASLVELQYSIDILHQ
jgi:hypothetical protein